MLDKRFKTISVRGRVSYGICCLEKVLIYYKCSLEKWKWILEKLWQYTDIEYLDDWYYEIAEFLPDSILEDTHYKTEEFEYLSETEFYSLVELYKQESNVLINQIFRLIFEMGTMDLYSKLEGEAKNSLICLKKINSAMTQNNIEVPAVEPFIKYSYSEENGWGRDFNGRELSIIL